MPYSSAWVPPEVYVTHGDVTVYHIYKNDDVEQGQMSFWYTTEETGYFDDAASGVFDVRDLAGWTPDCDHAIIMIAAIDRGDLPIKEED